MKKVLIALIMGSCLNLMAVELTTAGELRNRPDTMTIKIHSTALETVAYVSAYYEDSSSDADTDDSYEIALPIEDSNVVSTVVKKRRNGKAKLVKHDIYVAGVHCGHMVKDVRGLFVKRSKSNINCSMSISKKDNGVKVDKYGAKYQAPSTFVVTIENN